MMFLRRAPVQSATAHHRLLARGPLLLPPGIHILRCFPVLIANSCLNSTISSVSAGVASDNPLEPVEEASIAEDRSGGHIAANQNEALFFVNNTFFLPVKFAFALEWLMPSQYNLDKLAAPSRGSDLEALARRVVGEGNGIEIVEVVPRFKDGGAFVKVKYPEGSDLKKLTEAMQVKLRVQPVRSWHSPIRGVDVSLVKGIPWLEDLRRFPGKRIKIEFTPKNPDGVAAELSQENLFSLFRRYGKISEIVSQPFDSKILPRYAYVDFASLDDAIMARNCLHGIIIPAELGGGKEGTRLRTSYETNVRMKNLWNWITSHPRIVIPLFVAVLTTITVSVFDPIRQWFVQMHIQHSFDFNKNAVYAWFKTRTEDLLQFAGVTDKAAFSAVWEQQQGLIDDIKNWTRQNTETFTVIHGPRGSGKSELVLNQALGDRRNVLVIDCKPIAEARGESTALKYLANSVGYRPIFAWAYSMASLVDLAIQGTTGVKSSFSETFEAQISRILHTTAVALKEASVADRKHMKDAELSEDAFLEAHPERRSVVVIDNFLHGVEENTVLYDKLTEWAAVLIQNHAAHIIFMTSDASYTKALSRVLPDRAVNQIALGYLAPDVARSYILSRISAGIEDATVDAVDEAAAAAAARQRVRSLDFTSLNNAIRTLGGRVTDLEALARRLNAGETPGSALSSMITQLASDIVRMYLTPRATRSDGASIKAWTPSQAWVIVSQLAEKDALNYEDVMISGLFMGDPVASAAAIDALAAQELISVRWKAGRPRTIHAGSPANQAAFRAVLGDEVLRARLELDTLLELQKVETRKIEKFEGELIGLGTLPKQPWQVGTRTKYLLGKLEVSQKKVDEYEEKILAMKKVLSSSG